LDLLVTSAPATGVDSHLCLIFVSEVKPRGGDNRSSRDRGRTR